MAILKSTKEFKIPQHWSLEKLGQLILEAQPGFACGERDEDGVIQLRMNNVDTRGNFVWDEYIRVPATDDLINRYQLKNDDVLFNNTNSTELVGKSAIFQNFTEPVVYSNHFTRLRPDREKLLPEFLAFWLLMNWQQGIFAQICNRWIGQSAVKMDKLFSLNIYLPPLSEQKNIVSILNEQMAAIEKARKATETQMESITTLPNAYLKENYFGTNSFSWAKKKLGEICEINPKRPYFDRLNEAHTSFIPMSAVDDITGTISSIEKKPFSEVSKGYTYFEENDVLFAKITPCMENGKHVIASGLIDRIGFGSTEFHVIRPNFLIIPEWIHFFLRQSSILKAATNYFTGAVGQQRVPGSFLYNLLIPLPPVDVQKDIVKKLNNKFVIIDKIRQDIKCNLKLIQTLPLIIINRFLIGDFKFNE